MIRYPLDWLPRVLLDAGLRVAPVDGWERRGIDRPFAARGVMVHHTGGPAQGNMPSLAVVRDGRRDLPGPLSQLALGRDGTFYVVAAGFANHAGPGAWRGIAAGNSHFIGIEAENTGRDADQPWPDVQMDALRTGVAALLRHIGADSGLCCGHKEWALPAGRKPDPRFDMAGFRDEVAQTIRGERAPRPLIPAVDAHDRPTLSRGAAGAHVAIVQAGIGVVADGMFGARTEAALRRWQADRGLVPDGIAGPRTWAALQA